MNSLTRFIIFRLLALVPTVFGIIVVTFILSHIVPGNPALILIGPEVNGAELKVLENELGLNKPLYVQFGIYLNDLIHLNLGYSYILGEPVNYEIATRFPASFELAIAAMVIGLPAGIYLGIYSALRANRAGDHISRVFSLLGISMPVFWIEIVMILVFYTYLGLAPAPFGQLSPSLTPPPRITGMVILDSLITGNFVDFGNAIWHIILPAVGLSLALIATLSRVVRSSMLDVLNRDFMRTAFAIGLPRNILMNRYALRNALLPAITVAAIQAGALMSGVVLTETVFSWQGLGLYAVQAIDQLDYPSVMAVVLVSGLLFALVNFVADLLYAYVDPRVRLQ
ncbi:peptide ABC transporter permease [Thermogymnomonas acidicola]|uniref:Peptide ABC transporter permease n=2 Tax=Thermogymnomonas acidicola TaxID=399579 RepID=A0AA37BS49_9ARCH|nr:ABC transporter permease [Thermogymnomonas acidicola]GGM77223.1 peptide ABC transporter permease [Thermogymnomonas acidicola]